MGGPVQGGRWLGLLRRLLSSAVSAATNASAAIDVYLTQVCVCGWVDGGGASKIGPRNPFFFVDIFVGLAGNPRILPDVGILIAYLAFYWQQIPAKFKKIREI